jgi:hypothetical protein
MPEEQEWIQFKICSERAEINVPWCQDGSYKLWKCRLQYYSRKTGKLSISSLNLTFFRVFLEVPKLLMSLIRKHSMELIIGISTFQSLG